MSSVMSTSTTSNLGSNLGNLPHLGFFAGSCCRALDFDAAGSLRSLGQPPGLGRDLWDIKDDIVIELDGDINKLITSTSTGERY